MPEPEVRYCTTEDGVRIAYCVEGEGTPFVMCPHLFEAFSLEYLFPELAEIRRRLGEGHRVVRYDARGTGLSQRDVDDVSHAALVRDLEAVVAATGMSGFALSGSAFSGARAVEYAARHPEAVRQLVLWGGSARFGDLFPEREFRSFAEFAKGNWVMAAQTFADMDLRQRQALPEEDRLGFGKLLRQSVSGEMAAKILLSMYETADVSAVLTSVRVPTLVIERKRDSQRGQALASNIPNARLVLVSGETSFALETALPGIEAIREFIGDTIAPRGAPASSQATAERSLRTVLFTDLVGHTEMMSRLGDERGRDVLREHERITRDVLKAHDGSEVKTMGDGFMASFASVTKAVECAIALQRAFATHNADVGAHGHAPLHVRVGLNAGEPIAEDNDLFGATVILASRIAAQAGAGEILVPDTVRGLCSGKGFLFADRGEFVPKGFDEAVRLYEVRWRD